MNRYYLILTSSSSSHTETTSTVNLDDHTELVLNMDGVFHDSIPLFVSIDWGDGKEEIFDNDIYSDASNRPVLTLNHNTVLITRYAHQYYPSSTALYKNFTLVVRVGFSDGNESVFTVPVVVRAYGFFDTFSNYKLKNVSASSQGKRFEIVGDTGTIELAP